MQTTTSELTDGGDIEPADIPGRLAILRKIAELEDADIPDEVLEVIAEHVGGGMQTQTRAVIRIATYSSKGTRPLTRDSVTMVLGDMIPTGDEP